jgi:hypothetical protein
MYFYRLTELLRRPVIFSCHADRVCVHRSIIRGECGG